MSAIAELAEDRVVEGVYAVTRKRRLRTRSGSDYLALELVDPSGRIEARVWNDVDLLDSRFAEGDAVRVLGRVERFRNRLQLDVRTIEPAEETDPAALAPDRSGATSTSSTASSTSSPARSRIPGCRRPCARSSKTGRFGRRSDSSRPPSTGITRYAGGLLEHTVGVATICRELTQLHPRLRGDLLGAAALLHDVGRTKELGPAPAYAQTPEGRLLGHVHLGLRLIEERATPLEADVRAELLHAVSAHHDARAARTAEAACLYHANQLDAVAATRPVETPDS